MKIIVKKIDVKDVLLNLQGLTNRKTSLLITKNILLKTMDSKIIISATDLETGFEGIYPAIVKKEGIVAIDARKFSEIVKKFPDENIIINEIETKWIEIKNDSNNKIEFYIKGLNSEDFPIIPKFEDISFITVESVDIKRMINIATIIQPTKEEKREHIIGVNFEVFTKNNEKTVRMVSTDSKRLIKIDFPYENLEDKNLEDKNLEDKNLENENLKDENVEDENSENEDENLKKIIIPKTGLIEINKFLDNFGTVQIGIKNNHFIIKKDNEIILVKLLEGIFPKYEKVLKIYEKFAIEFNTNNLKAVLERMSILTSNGYDSVIFHFDNNKLVVIKNNPETGESKEDIDIVFLKEPIEVCFNPKYFIDILNNIQDEIVVLYIKNAESPCCVKGQNDENILSVIMPIRI